MTTLVMSGRAPGLEHLDLEVIEDKDICVLTGQTPQDLNRMVQTGINRKPKKETTIGNPDLIDKFHNFLLENSKIAIRDGDSQIINGTHTRNQYLNDSKSVLLEKFIQNYDFDASKTSLWRLMKKPQFKIFKMPRPTHIQHAVCDKCSQFRLLKDSIYNSELSSYLDPKEFPNKTICDAKKLICYSNDCFECSRSQFQRKLLDKFDADDPVLDEEIEFAFIKSDNSYDTDITSIKNFIMNNIPDMLYGMGNSGTKQKYVNHLKRADETEKYHKFVMNQIQNKKSVAAHLDYAMELTRDVARETQNQHYKKKGWPILGLIDYLPDKSKVYRYYIGEIGQAKSAEFTKQGILQRNDRIKDLITNPSDIEDFYILNDGACNEFWCSLMMAEYPSVFLDLKKSFPNIKNLYVSKFAAGHGKGEIDAT